MLQLAGKSLQSGELLLIGRGSHCDIQLDDPSASRVHCRVLARDGKVFLTDAGSRWGTFVNGQRVTECELRPGDELTVGETLLMLCAEGTPDATTLARRSEVRRPWKDDAQPEEFPAAMPMEAVFPRPQAMEVKHRPLMPSDFIGQRFFHYDVQSLLLRTASGLRLRATSIDKTPISLHLFHPGQFADGRARQRFLRAIETMRGLSHENLERLDEGGTFEGVDFLATEYVAGQSVAELVHQIGVSGMLDWRRTLRIAIDLAAAMEFLNEHAVVHRNITPDNILISDADNRAILGGLILAKALDDQQPQLTQAGEVVGDLAYQSPEQLGSGEPIDARSDFYQLGATLYALLTGRPPFHGRTHAETIQHVLVEVPIPPTKYHLAIPPLIEGFVLRLLSKRPQDRFENAIKLSNELDRIKTYCGI